MNDRVPNERYKAIRTFREYIYIYHYSAWVIRIQVILVVTILCHCINSLGGKLKLHV